MTFPEFKHKYQKEEVQEVFSSTPKNPVISILVQTYQQKDYIKECLDGILMQKTLFDFEVLIGEDNSTDRTREICIEYAKKFPNHIRLFLHHRANQIKILDEATSNFNSFYNFFSAKGKYIAFCEGDDIWTDPFKLQKEINFLEANKEYVFTYHRFQAINSKGQNLDNILDNSQPSQDISSEELRKLIYHPLLLCTCFRNVLTELPKEMVEIINVDSFLFNLLGNFGGAKFLSCIEPSKYRKHTEGIWSKRKDEKKLLSKIHTYRKLYEYHKGQNNMELANVFQQKLKVSFKMLVFKLIKAGKLISAVFTSFKYLEIKK